LINFIRLVKIDVSKMFRIGNIIGVQAKSVSGDWSIHCGRNDKTYSLRLTINTGREDGVRILLASGPENASELAEKAIAEIIESAKPSQIKGVLISIHNFADFMGCLKKRGEPLFPGWPEGDDGERVAWVIFQELLSQVDYAIFIEGPEPGITSIPHATIYSIDTPPTLSCHPELIKMMGHDLIVEKTGMKGSLAVEAQREFALPILITQIDETEMTDKTLEWTKEKVNNFLSYAGLIPSCIEIPERTFIATLTGEVRAANEGELSLDFSLFAFLSSGEKVGSILKAQNNKRIEIENEGIGYVVRKRNEGHVLVDDFIYSLLEVHFRSFASSILYCNTLIDNSEMQDVKIRGNELFHRLNRV